MNPYIWLWAHVSSIPSVAWRNRRSALRWNNDVIERGPKAAEHVITFKPPIVVRAVRVRRTCSDLQNEYSTFPYCTVEAVAHQKLPQWKLIWTFWRNGADWSGIIHTCRCKECFGMKPCSNLTSVERVWETRTDVARQIRQVKFAGMDKFNMNSDLKMVQKLEWLWNK